MGQLDLRGSPDSGRAGPELKIGSPTPRGGAGAWAPAWGRARSAADRVRPEPRTAGPRRASPARRVLAAAGAAAAEQREQQAEEQSKQRTRAHHALALVGLCGKAQGSARVPAPLASPSTGSPLNDLPRRQAPVTGSHESSWQLQAWAQSTPWSPGGHVRLQLRGHGVRKDHGSPP